MNWLILTLFGMVSGTLAGLLGIGGGSLLVPLLVATGFTPVHAVGTSNLAIIITAISGSIQNWRMGYLDIKNVLAIGLPALLTAQVGAYLAEKISPTFLLVAFAGLLLSNIYLMDLRKKLTAENGNPGYMAESSRKRVFQLLTGGAAGLLAGLFGVGGGLIMVPLQILLLGEPIKSAIQTSLGVIVITAISASIAHSLYGNVFWIEGILLGIGGLLGAQIGTRYLPKLSDDTVRLSFRVLLLTLAVYTFWKAWQIY
jgi:uncharacterized membrane protein YfcA